MTTLLTMGSFVLAAIYVVALLLGLPLGLNWLADYFTGWLALSTLATVVGFAFGAWLLMAPSNFTVGG